MSTYVITFAIKINGDNTPIENLPTLHACRVACDMGTAIELFENDEDVKRHLEDVNGTLHIIDTNMCYFS